MVAGFLIGCIVGAFGMICLALCQAQDKDNTSEKIYFGISTEIDGIKLYLNRSGVYSDFSIENTLLARSIKDLNNKYKEITSNEIDVEVIIEKIGVNTKHIQSFC